MYVPTVIVIKRRPDLDEAPHLIDELQRQRLHLSCPDRIIVQKSLCGSALIAHPENVLYAMLGDDLLGLRSRAVRMVHEARACRQPMPVCQFRVHSSAVNVSSRHYTQIVDLP